MAKIIVTGQHEAISLKVLHGQQVLQVDEEAHEMISRNGGFAEFILALKRGVFDLVTVCKPVSLRPNGLKSKHKHPAA